MRGSVVKAEDDKPKNELMLFGYPGCTLPRLSRTVMAVFTTCTTKFSLTANAISEGVQLGQANSWLSPAKLAVANGKGVLTFWLRAGPSLLLSPLAVPLLMTSAWSLRARCCSSVRPSRGRSGAG